jgi:RNA polymerase sigma factor for flagellar operon FliA
MSLQRQPSASAVKHRAVRDRVAFPRRAADRQALLVSHVGLVHHVARQLARRLSTEAQLDELVSAGSLGLIQAVDSFDPKRGLAFSTYAVPRIRGAILDELRRLDHVSRGVRRRAREVSQARSALGTALGREPSEAELSKSMHVPASVLRQWELELQGAALASLDQPVRSDHPGSTLGDAIMDDRFDSVEETLTQQQELARVRDAIAGLKEQERTVLALSFYEELKLQEIAQVLGLSVCRISQIRTAALARLRVKLSGLRVA